jgi:hypothetical protein
MRFLLEAGIVDDAYIFLRYAENITHGAGAVFNTGERVEGYTSPLWLLCLSALGRLGIDLASAATLLGAGLAMLTVALVVYAAIKWVIPSNPVLAVMPALFLVTSPIFEYWAWSGLETGLFTLLFLGAFLAFLRNVRGERSLFVAGLLFTLAALTRLEIVVLLPVYLTFIFLFNRGQVRLLAGKYISFIAPAALLVLHFVWRYSYYHSWLPNTFYAKVGLPIGSLLRSGLLYTFNFALSHILYFIFVFVVVLLARSEIFRSDLWRLAFATIVVWSAYVTWVGGDHFAMFRFYLPLLPLIGLLFADGLSRFSERYSGVNRQRFVFVLLVVAMLVCASSFLAYQRFEGYRAREEVYLTRQWTNVGAWLKQNVPPDSSLASMVVGAIPYYSGLKTYDMLGLVDSHISREGHVYPDGAVGHQKYDSDYILLKRPDYIIYPWSGRYEVPVSPSPQDIPLFYYYSVYDLIKNPRTQQLYEFRSVRMDDGTHIDYLQLLP